MVKLGLDTGNMVLREAHPQHFKGMVLKVFILFLVGLTMLIRPEWIVEAPLLKSPRIIPMEFWGMSFMVISAMLLYGITDSINRYRWARRALISGAAITGIWAVGYIFAMITGVSDRPFAVIFWIYTCANFIIWTGEPAFNPLSSALHRDNNRSLRDDV